MGSSIPVFSIVIKYNMVENGFSKTTGFVWGVVFPWVTAFPLFYMPNALAQFVNFTSLIFVSFTDFIVPWALYIVLQRQQRGTNECAARAVFLAREVERPAGVHLHNALPSWEWLSSAVKI